MAHNERKDKTTTMDCQIRDLFLLLLFLIALAALHVQDGGDSTCHTCTDIPLRTRRFGLLSSDRVRLSWEEPTTSDTAGREPAQREGRNEGFTVACRTWLNSISSTNCQVQTQLRSCTVEPWVREKLRPTTYSSESSPLTSSCTTNVSRLAYYRYTRQCDERL